MTDAQSADYIDLIKEVLGATELVVDPASSPLSIEIKANNLLKSLDQLYTDERTYFDLLSCITALDNGPESGTMEIIYNLYSIPFEKPLMVRVVLDRAKPIVPTVSTIWKTALWHERESFDLLGIKFEGHPDLRRILLPADWEGHPLRKDYDHQEYYHGIKVEY